MISSFLIPLKARVEELESTPRKAFIMPTNHMEDKLNMIQPRPEIEVVKHFLAQTKIVMAILLTIFGTLGVTFEANHFIEYASICVGLFVS